MTTLHTSHAHYNRIAREAPLGDTTLLGMRIVTNNMFPFTTTCEQCDGTGEQDYNTACPRCDGQGATRVVGMMQGYTTTLLTEPLPRRFYRHFPPGLVARPQLCRGLI